MKGQEQNAGSFDRAQKRRVITRRGGVIVLLPRFRHAFIAKGLKSLF